MPTATNGYAAAAQPISTQAIHTPDTELVAGDVQIPVGEESMPGYRAMPADGCLFPIVIVVQEIFGLHEYIRDVCRRLARRGYVAIAPQTFFRAGDPSGLTDVAEIRPIVNATSDRQTMEDLDDTVAWAVRESHGDSGRVGITGFCWGGRTVWLYAAYSTTLKSGVAWYGRLAGDVTDNQPTWPIDVARSLRCPVLGLYGAEDLSIPVDLVDRMRSEFAVVGDPSEFVVYPEAGHGFHADYRPNYHEKSARDGENRMFEWLASCGVS